MTSILCYHCKTKHDSVAQVKDCAKVSSAFAAKVETGKIVEVVLPAKVKVASVPAHRLDPKYLALKKIQTPAVVTVPVVTPAQKEAAKQLAEAIADVVFTVKTGQDLELGMYQTVHPETGAITIYKVKFNKAGTHKLAEKLSITGGHYGDKPKGKFWYAPGMMAKLTSENKMTEEQAKAFHDATKAKYGVDYGFCCVCGKLLTVKKSIDAGIGPVCVTKF